MIASQEFSDLYTLPETNSRFAPENNNGFKIDFFSGPGRFAGAFAVSFREGMYALPGTDISQLKEDEVSFSHLVVHGLVLFPEDYTIKRLLELRFALESIWGCSFLGDFASSKTTLG